MNKIYKVMYSKVKQCAIVVSEIAKSHGHHGESSGVKKHAALTAAVLIALGSLSFTTAFMPMTAEADDWTKTDGSNFVGVERRDGLFADSDYANYNGHGAHGDDSITVGLKAIGGDGTITIGDRRAEKSLGSVYVGRGPGMPTGKVLPDKTDDGYWATSVGYQSDATGYGSIAIGSNATANNSYDKDSTGHGITLRTTSGDGKTKTVVLNGKPDIQRASVAIGYGANADNGNIAIGSYSDASTDLRTAKTAAYLTDTNAGSYVSVGKSDALRRISNVADGAADSDAATVSQLKKAVEATDASKKANIDATNIGKNLKYKADGKTAAESSDIKTNEDAWGTAIGTGEVKDKNGQLVTGGTVFNALQEQKNDLTGKLSVTAGWGINIDKENGNTISLKRNLGTNYGNEYKGKGKVTFEADGENSLILGGGAINDSSYEADKDFTYGAHAKDSVLVGGMNNDIEKNSERALIVGGTNTKIFSTGEVQQTGTDAIIVGGLSNKAEGDGAVLIGGEKNEASGLYSITMGGESNKNAGWESSIVGGVDNEITTYGQGNSIFGGGGNKITYGAGASILGGFENIANMKYATVVGGGENKSSGVMSSVFGGANNFSNANASTVIGGQLNTAVGAGSVVSGGGRNLASREYSYAAGGLYNNVTGAGASSLGGQYSSVNGTFSTGVAGGSTGQDAMFSLAAGYQSVVADSGIEKTDLSEDNPEDADELNKYSEALEAYGEGDKSKMESLSGYYELDPDSSMGHAKVTHYDKFSTALGYQATADEPGTIAFGHDAGDESGYTYEWETLTDENGNPKQNEIDGTTNDYTKAPKSVKKKAPYTSAYYNRLVKIADGKDAHDAVTVEQLNKVQNDLDTSKTHFYNVNSKDTEAGNYNNDGAKGAGSMAAGFSTHADGIASTVTGSYSGVINSGTAQGLDLRGAAALSYGTVNVNQNTDPTKAYSGVANSIVGQANMTTNSNAAIIYGAGNTVTDSYRPIDKEKAKAILGSTSDPKALSKAMQDAVKDSGGQVMVMGGGNVVDNAYMSQVTGVGNTVKGNQVYAKNAKTGKWEWTTDTNKDTAIKGYDKDKSSQYNYVDGFNNEVINGKHDYVIGANNTVTGDSYDDKDAKKYSNESNIIFGDNHTVTNTKNAVIIGSSDTQMTLDQGDRATAIGHNASAQRDALAVGVNTEARGNAVALGTYSTAHNNSIAIGTKATAVSSQNLAIGWEAHIGNIKTDDEKIKNAIALGSDSQVRVNDLLESDNNRGVLSIGDKDKERRIIHVRAGVNDNDAVNVSQLKSVQSGLTDKGLTFVTNDGERTAKLGSKVTIQGTDKKDGHEYTADNLTTKIDEKGNITILMDKDMSTETLAVNGKDAKDGQPGTAGSIGIKGQDGQAGIGINGKDGISITGKDGKNGVTIKVDNGKDGKDGSEGHIGLNGRDGSSIDITVKNGYDGANGINGKNGVDGTSLTRIVYTDKTGEHQVATMEDGLKFKGDDETVIAKKLNNTLEIIGGAKGDLTEGNIGVKSTKDHQLKVQLAKDLTSITSISNQKTEGDKTTGAKITLGNDGSVDVNGGKITNVGSGIEADANGRYTVTDQNKGNAANIGDVQNMVNDAKTELTDGANGLNKKANIDASNIGKNNAEKWGSAIGTGKIEANNGQLVTGKTVYDEVRPKNDGSYVKKDKTTGENLSALDSKIGKLDKDGTYVHQADSISKNLSNLDTQVKTNADAISNITNNIGNLSDSAVKYDADTNKGKVTLAGADGTTITNLKAGEVAETSKDAVNGSQLYAEQKARTDADNKLTSDLAAETQARTAADTAINNKIGSLDANGNYIQKDASISSNLSTLDTQVKSNADSIQKNSDLIHTNTAGDTIQIGESSTATKIDVHGKDSKGRVIDRVITGVVTDPGDNTSAANVDYVNGVTAANTQQIYRDMNNAYGRLNNNINKAAAGSNALAALHPLDYDPDDKADFAVGYGHYRNANAAAVGAFYHPNENTMVNVGVSLGNGDPGFNAGVSFKIGSGSAGHQAMSKTEMAKVINSQSKEIDALKKDNADKDKRIDALEQKMAEILAKLDKNGK